MYRSTHKKRSEKYERSNSLSGTERKPKKLEIRRWEVEEGQHAHANFSLGQSSPDFFTYARKV